MTVTVYSTASCAYCRMLKSYLEKNQVAYEEKQADLDPALAHELLEESGQLGVPFTIIEADDGTKEKVLGFDQHKLQEALKLS